MNAEPQLVGIRPSLYAYVHRTVPVAEIGAAMGQGIAAVTSALKAQGVTPAGPWFTHHFRKPTDFFDYEICFPVAAPITPTDDVQNGTWSAMTVARLIHAGNYDSIGQSWMALEAWIKAQGLTAHTEFWERYLVTPHTDPEPANWRSELNWPVSR